MLRTRLILGAVLIALVLGLLGLDYLTSTDYAFTSLAAICIASACYETARMFSRHSAYMPVGLLTISSALLVACQWLDAHLTPSFNLTFTCASIVLLGLILSFVACGRVFLAPGLFYCICTLALVWFPLSFLIRLRFLKVALIPHAGEYLLFYLIVTAKVTDSAAYFTGRALGKRKFAPEISPHKTIAGATGGWIFGVATGTLLWYISPWENSLALPWAILSAAAISAAAQLGDLTESLLKRYCQVKDSGRCLMAFGGVFDMLDSFLLSGMVAYFLAITLIT
jgi:phosphatidate cytidylyltransferase